MKISKQKGFTIIEVVLVLAIAALIFLMVFIALPALQANQRDTARKNDASTVAAAVQSYASTERHPITGSTSETDLVKYIDKLDQYNKDSDININAKLANNAAIPVTATDKINIYVGNKCDGTKVIDGNSRTAAVTVVLEQGAGNLPHCVDV